MAMVETERDNVRGMIVNVDNGQQKNDNDHYCSTWGRVCMGEEGRNPSRYHTPVLYVFQGTNPSPNKFVCSSGIHEFERYETGIYVGSVVTRGSDPAPMVDSCFVRTV